MRRPSARSIRAAFVLVVGMLASMISAEPAFAKTTSSTVFVVSNGTWYAQPSSQWNDTLDINGTMLGCKIVLVNDDEVPDVGPDECKPGHITGSVKLGSGTVTNGCPINTAPGTAYRCARGSLSLSFTLGHWYPFEFTYGYITIDLVGALTTTGAPQNTAALNLVATDVTTQGDPASKGPALVQGELHTGCLVGPNGGPVEGCSMQNMFSLLLESSAVWL